MSSRINRINVNRSRNNGSRSGGNEKRRLRGIRMKKSRKTFKKRRRGEQK